MTRPILDAHQNTPSRDGRAASLYTHMVLLVIVGVAIVVVMYPIDDNYFLIDDFIFLADADISRDDFWNVLTLHQNFIRPINNIYYLLCYSYFGLDAKGYYQLNVAFHIVNASLVYILAFLLFNRRLVAALAALLFAINSIHAETVFWIAAVTGGHVTVLYLLVVIFFILYLRHARGMLYALSLGLFVLALFTKEYAISIPLVLFVYAYLFQDKHNNSLLDLVKLLLPFFIIMAAYLGLQLYVQLSVGHFRSGTYGVGIHMIPQMIIGFISTFLSLLR